MVSAVKIQPITSDADLRDIVILEEKAYGVSSPMLRLMFPPSPDIAQSALQKSKTDRHMNVWKSDPTVRYIKATTREQSQTGTMVERLIGAAVYHIYEPSHSSSDRNPWPRSSHQVPKGANASLCLFYFKTLTEARLTFMGDDEASHAFLANLVVEPRRQGRGVGTQLMEFMTTDIIETFMGGTAGTGRPSSGCVNGIVKCWLDASPKGLDLYRRLGWQEVGEKIFELEPWGGKKWENHRNVHMVKEISLSLD